MEKEEFRRVSQSSGSAVAGGGPSATCGRKGLRLVAVTPWARMPRSVRHHLGSLHRQPQPKQTPTRAPFLNCRVVHAYSNRILKRSVGDGIWVAIPTRCRSIV